MLEQGNASWLPPESQGNSYLPPGLSFAYFRPPHNVAKVASPGNKVLVESRKRSIWVLRIKKMLRILALANL